MRRLICVYKGNKTECTTGFVKDGYVKIYGLDSEIRIEELDEYYAIIGSVIYKGYSFDGLGSIKNAVKKGRIFIFTSDSEIAKELKFGRHDVGTWVLEIPLSEVEKVIVKKEYLAGEKKGQIESYEEDIMTFFKKLEKILVGVF